MPYIKGEHINPEKLYKFIKDNKENLDLRILYTNLPGEEKEEFEFLLGDCRKVQVGYYVDREEDCEEYSEPEVQVYHYCKIDDRHGSPSFVHDFLLTKVKLIKAHS